MNFDRHRRLRINPLIRDMICETRVETEQLIQPIFVNENLTEPMEINSMRGQYQYPVEGVIPFIEECAASGIRSFILFGIPTQKDRRGSGAYDAQGVIQRTLRFVKSRVKDVLLVADTCLCEYTNNGQCGIFDNGHL
jgi:porphobilinogen synthase